VPACSTSTCARLSSRLDLPVNTSTSRLDQLKRRLVQSSYQVGSPLLRGHAHVHTPSSGARLQNRARARAAEKPEQCSAFRSASPRVPYLLDARENASRQGLVKGPRSDASVMLGAGDATSYDLQLMNRLPRSHDSTIRVLGVACSVIGLLFNLP
jgi:hypothetical protein